MTTLNKIASNNIVIIRGGGDLASGVAHCLFTSGFPVIILELSKPLAIRRTVSFSEAVYEREWKVEGVTSKLIEQPEILPDKPWHFIPVIVDPGGHSIAELQPVIIVDARMTKQNPGTKINYAPLIIGLGPGFTAGKDVHFVIETSRGDSLGKIIDNGTALPDTGVPGELGGESARRVIRTPASGIFTSNLTIGTKVSSGDVIGYLNSDPATSAISGILRGLLRNGLYVPQKTKIADVDPRYDTDVAAISDKSNIIAQSVLQVARYKFENNKYCINRRMK